MRFRVFDDILSTLCDGIHGIFCCMALENLMMSLACLAVTKTVIFVSVVVVICGIWGDVFVIIIVPLAILMSLFVRSFVLLLPLFLILLVRSLMMLLLLL